MASTDRGALGLLVVAALMLGARFAPERRYTGPPAWRVYWEETGGPLWTTEVAFPEGVRLGGDGLPAGRVGGRLGLLTGTRLDPAGATREDWLVLPGIGEKTATEILAARTKLGGFSTNADILEVKGIGPKKLEKLSPWLAER